jgi:LacI family transcriptional regulator
MRPTIKDIAEAVGVTHGVVSSVLNGTSGRVRASEETAERIRRVAKELGYHPSTFARSFRSSQTNAIGVLHGDGLVRLRLDGDSRYFASLMDGIIDGAFKHGYTVAMCPRLMGNAYMGALADGRFDGYIWYSTNPIEEAFNAIKKCPYPIVLIHSPASDFDYKIPTVICDNVGGVRLALDHLKSFNHRKIAFASNHTFEFTESRLRRDAFVSQGTEMGLELTLADTSRGVDHLVEDWVRDRSYTAIIAHNEGLAAAIMSSVQCRGFAIPDDLSVVGFDSTAFCLLSNPPLTSVAQPLGELGQLAVERLVEILSGKDPQIETVLPCTFDIRGSTGRAPTP